jgi:hypothetical protein
MAQHATGPRGRQVSRPRRACGSGNPPPYGSNDCARRPRRRGQPRHDHRPARRPRPHRLRAPATVVGQSVRCRNRSGASRQARRCGRSSGSSSRSALPAWLRAAATPRGCTKPRQSSRLPFAVPCSWLLFDTLPQDFTERRPDVARTPLQADGLEQPAQIAGGALVEIETDSPTCRPRGPRGRLSDPAFQTGEANLIEFIKARGRALDREQVSNGSLTHPPATPGPGNKARTHGLPTGST